MTIHKAGEEQLEAHDEDRRLPARVASLAAKVGEMERTVAQLSSRVDGLATKEQLENQAKLLTMQLNHQQSTLELKLTAVTNEIRQDLAPIKRGIYYAVGVILTAFLTGALGLVLIQPKP